MAPWDDVFIVPPSCRRSPTGVVLSDDPTIGPSERYRLEAVTRWRERGALRAAALVPGILASGAMVVVGCQTLTDGSATVGSDVPTYRASVSSSMAASSSRSAARVSEQQASRTAAAVHTACDALSITSVNAVDAVNLYVHEFNDNGPNVDGTARAAIDALNQSADQVTASLSDALAADLRRALTAWVDSARGVADVIVRNLGMDAFNAAASELNAVKTTALDLCDAAY